MTLGTVAMFHGDANSRRFASVERCAVATEHLDRRPFRQNRNRWRRVRGELLRRMNDLSAHDGENRFDGFDLFLRDGKIVFGERDAIRQLSDRYCPLLSALTRKPTAALRVKPQCFLAA